MCEQEKDVSRLCNFVSSNPQTSGQYQCFATNEWGTATTNSVFVRKSELNNFKDEPPMTVSIEEGKPFGIDCESPDGWPPPSVYWMLQVSALTCWVDGCFVCAHPVYDFAKYRGKGG